MEINNFKNHHYDNIKMFSKEGVFLAYTDLKKKNWYLKRKLAIVKNEKDFQLLFNAGGEGNVERNDYYRIPLENKCIVCGTKEELTRHHIVPSEFRKHFSKELKSHSSFDLKILCHTCHSNYHIEGDKYKLTLLKKYGLEHHEEIRQKLRSYVKAILNHKEKIPAVKLMKLKYFIKTNSNINIENRIESEKIIRNWEHVSKRVVKKATQRNLNNFIIGWRKHFIETTKPKFIEQTWLDNMEVIEVCDTRS